MPAGGLRPLTPEHPDDETFEGLLIVRPEGRLFFVNAQDVSEQINALVAEHEPRVVALDLSRVAASACCSTPVPRSRSSRRCRLRNQGGDPRARRRPMATRSAMPAASIDAVPGSGR